MKASKIVLVLFLTVCFSCEKETDLKGTKWKWVSYVYSVYKEEVEPKECTECNILTFDTDYTATMLSITQTFKLDLLHPKPGGIDDKMLHTELYEGDYYDGVDILRRTIPFIKSYKLRNNELKLYKNKSNYLLFKQIPL